MSSNVKFAPDSYGYISAAKSYEIGCFSNESNALGCLKPSLNWHPLYPFILFIISKFGLNYIFSIPIQSILFVLACFFCTNSIHKITYRKLPFIFIYLLFLLCPITIQWHRWVLMDSFLTSVSLIFIGLAAEIIRKRNITLFISLILTLIIGYHLKLIYLAFVFGLLLITFTMSPLINLSKKKLISMTLVILFIAFTPIQIRNIYLWNEPLFNRFPTTNKAYAPGYYEWLKTHLISELDMVNYLNPLLTGNLEQIIDYPLENEYINEYLNRKNLLEVKKILSERKFSEQYNLSIEDDKKFRNLSINFWDDKNTFFTTLSLYFKRSFNLLIDPPIEWQFSEKIEKSGLAHLIQNNQLFTNKGFRKFFSISKIDSLKLSYRYIKYFYRFFILIISFVSITFLIFDFLDGFSFMNGIILSNISVFSLFCTTVIIPFLIMHAASVALEQRYVSAIFPFLTSLSINAIYLIKEKLNLNKFQYPKKDRINA